MYRPALIFFCFASILCAHEEISIPKIRSQKFAQKVVIYAHKLVRPQKPYDPLPQIIKKIDGASLKEFSQKALTYTHKLVQPQKPYDPFENKKDILITHAKQFGKKALTYTHKLVQTQNSYDPLANKKAFLITQVKQFAQNVLSNSHKLFQPQKPYDPLEDKREIIISCSKQYSEKALTEKPYDPLVNKKEILLAHAKQFGKKALTYTHKLVHQQKPYDPLENKKEIIIAGAKHYAEKALSEKTYDPLANKKEFLIAQSKLFGKKALTYTHKLVHQQKPYDPLENKKDIIIAGAKHYAEKALSEKPYDPLANKKDIIIACAKHYTEKALTEKPYDPLANKKDILVTYSKLFGKKALTCTHKLVQPQKSYDPLEDRKDIIIACAKHYAEKALSEKPYDPLANKKDILIARAKQFGKKALTYTHKLVHQQKPYDPLANKKDILITHAKHFGKKALTYTHKLVHQQKPYDPLENKKEIIIAGAKHYAEKALSEKPYDPLANKKEFLIAQSKLFGKKALTYTHKLVHQQKPYDPLEQFIHSDCVKTYSPFLCCEPKIFNPLRKIGTQIRTIPSPETIVKQLKQYDPVPRFLSYTREKIKVLPLEAITQKEPSQCTAYAKKALSSFATLKEESDSWDPIVERILTLQENEEIPAWALSLICKKEFYDSLTQSIVTTLTQKDKLAAKLKLWNTSLVKYKPQMYQPFFASTKVQSKLLPSLVQLVTTKKKPPEPFVEPKISPKEIIITPSPCINTPPPCPIAQSFLAISPPIFYPPQPCQKWVFPIVNALEWRIGGGRGYHRGYQTARTFLAAYQMHSHCYPFLDVRAHRVGKGRLATNLGVGLRTFSPCFDEMYGLNVYYDYRRVNHADFQQIGLGGEIFVNAWDFRINGYMPIGRKKALHDITIFEFTGGFVAKRNRFDAPMWGLDFEVGHPLLKLCNVEIYTAIGPYFYQRHRDSGFLGGMWRIGADICNCVSASLYVTHDRYFDTKVQGEITLHLPLPCCLKCLNWLFMPVWRNDIIVTERFCNFKNNF